jgi:hypothetical protein
MFALISLFAETSEFILTTCVSMSRSRFKICALTTVIINSTLQIVSQILNALLHRRDRNPLHVHNFFTAFVFLPHRGDKRTVRFRIGLHFILFRYERTHIVSIIIQCASCAAPCLTMVSCVLFIVSKFHDDCSKPKCAFVLHCPMQKLTLALL